MNEPTCDMGQLPVELDHPAAHGFTMRGWDFSRAEVQTAMQGHRMLNPAFELGTNICPWNCDFCFTENPLNVKGLKHRLSGEMTLERRLSLIDEAADLGARSINFVGAGEPTIDPGFWELLARMKARSIIPIVYTEGSLKLTSAEFVKKLFDTGATVVLKVNSLFNAEYQDAVLRGIRPKSSVPNVSYFEKRKLALENLQRVGFADSAPTRLAFDTIMCRENWAEIPDIHRFARSHNIFVLFVNYLPSGRTKDGHTSAVTWAEQHEMFRKLAEIDRADYGMTHAAHFPYAGGVPCTIRGFGLFVKIQGEVFDCPGELESLGNLQVDSLETAWNKAKEITKNFDGGCLPRKLFWERMARDDEKLHPR